MEVKMEGLKGLELFEYRTSKIVESGYEKVDMLGFFDVVFGREEVEKKTPFQDRMCEDYVAYVRHQAEVRERGKTTVKIDPMKKHEYNAICLDIKPQQDSVLKKNNKKVKHFLVLSDKDMLGELKNSDFAITSPITYVGHNRSAKNARYFFGFGVDLDGVGEKQIRALFHQMYKINYIPKANMIVNSGHGLHLYFLLDKPIALFANHIEVLNRIKRELTEIVWNWASSYLEERQYQGIFQGFRIPETKTKLGNKVEAFVNYSVPRYSIEKLVKAMKGDNKNCIITESEMNLLDKSIYIPDRLTRAKAMELYPGWYEKVIERGDRTRRYWVVNRGLYDWWLKRLRARDFEKEVKVGHRYFCLLTLSMFAIKCRIDEEELKQDLLSLVEPFDWLTPQSEEDNHFTEEDAMDALQAYKDDYCTFPKGTIELLTGIKIESVRRNGRKQKEHIKMISAIRDVFYPDGKWREGNGRKKGSTISANQSRTAIIIREWRNNNPTGRKIDCERETGISKPTILKWWDSWQLKENNDREK